MRIENQNSNARQSREEITMTHDQMTIGQRLFAAGRNGSAWYVAEVEAANEEWIGPGVNVLRLPGTSLVFRGPLADVFATVTEAQAVCDARQAEHELQKQQGRQQRAEAARRDTERRALADELYARAMSLAAGDVDDMDCVEHYCQGNVQRLREFIAARATA